MGFLLGGPFYHLRGRTGNNVGRIVKGRNVFSMRPTPSEKPPTLAQLAQRLKFGMITSWLSWVTPVLDIGFAAFAKAGSPYSAAVGYNMMHAISGVSPNFTINFTQVLFSRGPREPLANPVIAAAAGAVINVTWENVVVPEYGADTDQVTLVVYSVDQDRFVVQLNAVARSVEAFTLNLPITWEDNVVQVWGMVAGDGDVSTTQYMGQLTVLP